jgi:membrane associated rhomboid family serine protease
MNPSAGLDPSVFALIGAYFMLYGVPDAIPVAQGQKRWVRIAALAAIWLGFQIVFSVIAQSFDFSVTIIPPVGGLVVGVLLARPLLAWAYRKA